MRSTPPSSSAPARTPRRRVPTAPPRARIPRPPRQRPPTPRRPTRRTDSGAGRSAPQARPVRSGGSDAPRAREERPAHIARVGGARDALPVGGGVPAASGPLLLGAPGTPMAQTLRANTRPAGTVGSDVLVSVWRKRFPDRRTVGRRGKRRDDERR